MREVTCEAKEQEIKGEPSSVAYHGSEKIHSGNKTDFHPMEYESSYHASESISLYDEALRQVAALSFLRLTQAHCAAQCAN